MADLANMSPQAIAAWQRLNDIWGKPIPISSSYRDPETNARVGGAKGSQHLHGNAFDIPTAGMSPQEIDSLIKAAAKAGFRGFGGYGNSLHFDVGPQRTWGPSYGSDTTPEYLKAALSGAEFSPINYATPTISTKGGGTVTPDQIAQGAMAQSAGQEPEQPRGLLGNLFGNPDTMAALAMAFNSMRLNPDPNLAQVLSAQMKERRAERKDKAQINKTVEFLRKEAAAGNANAAKALAYVEATDDVAGGLKLYDKERVKGVAVDDKLVDPYTGKVIYEGAPAVGLTDDQLKALGSTRDQLRKDLGLFNDVQDGWNRISTFYNDPGGVSDYALAVAFAKVLDPGSAAREGEVSAVQKSGSISAALKSGLINAINGQGSLPPGVRQEIAELSRQIYTEKALKAQGTISKYNEMATAAGLPKEYLYMGGEIEIPSAIIPATIPPSAQSQGVTQEEWDAMTPEQKKNWM